MGQMIEFCIKEDEGASVAYKMDKNGALESLFNESEVVIDFSSPAASIALLEYARTTPKPLVIGTTGLDSTAKELLSLVSATSPVFYASNMSLGIAILTHLASEAAKKLQGFDIEILEMHHRHKKDAPSGTALSLAEAVADARDLNLEKVRVSARDGLIGERKSDEIGVMSLRGGDIIGRHTVGFYEEGEFLELTHTATSRATFAKGAIKIAKWLIKQDAGYYGMNDFLGL